MTTMDFKGIAWVGNVYQKFESMCLEVEESMYQDTAKFVENQVQTVGASVKKFYSDVVQDLLPPLPTDPVKVAAADLSVNPYLDAVVDKKPKASTKVDKLLIDKSRVITSVAAESTVSVNGQLKVNHVLQPYSGACPEEVYSELYLGKNNDGKIHVRSNVHNNGDSEKPKYIHPPSEKSRLNTLPEDRRASSFCCRMNDTGEAACQIIATTSPQASVRVSGSDTSEVEDEGKLVTGSMVAHVIADDSAFGSPLSDTIPSIESSDKEGTKLKTILSSGSLSTKCIDTCTNSGLVSRVDPYIGRDTQHNEHAGEEAIMSHTGNSGDSRIDVIEDDGTAKPCIESMEQCDDMSKLEETCILVDSDRLHFMPHSKGKQKSYKKKIRDAFSLKTRSARKQEYKQLAARYGDADPASKLNNACSPTPTLTLASNTKKIPTHDLCESEWELL